MNFGGTVWCLNSINMSAVEAKVPFSFLKLSQVCFIVLVFAPITPGYNVLFPTEPPNLSPYFDDISKREIEAIVGQTLVLPCTVRNLRDKVVSWIRSRDLHILTSGRQAFSSDSRFEPVHYDSSEDFWGLRLRSVEVEDSGQYECQVNTDPKMSLAMKLTVQVPGVAAGLSKWVSRAGINGPREVYVQNGSPATLTCEISPLSPTEEGSAHGVLFAARPRVWWLHDGQDVGREDRIRTEYRYKDKRILSRFLIPSVSWQDAGQYTCTQPSTKPDNVKLIVVEAETSEAMQRDYPVTSGIKLNENCFRIILLTLLMTKLF